MGCCSSKATGGDQPCSSGNDLPSTKTTARYSLKNTEASSYFLSTTRSPEPYQKRTAKPRQLEKIAAARVQLSQLPESSLTVRGGYSVGSVERWRATTTQHLFEDPREETIIEETAFSLDAGSGSLAVVPFANPTQDIMYGGADSTVASSISKSSWTTTTRDARLDPPTVMTEEELNAVRVMRHTRKATKRRSAKTPDDVISEKHEHDEEGHHNHPQSPKLAEEAKLATDHNHEVHSRGRARHKRRSLKFTQEEGEVGQVENSLDAIDQPIAHGVPPNEIDSSKRTTAAATTTTTATVRSCRPSSEPGNEMAQMETTKGGFTERLHDQEQNVPTSELGESDVTQSPPQSSSQTPQSEEGYSSTHPDNAPTTPTPQNPKPKLSSEAIASKGIIPTPDGQNIDPKTNLGNRQAHEITPQTAKTSNRKVGSKSPRRFGGPENLPLVSPKLIGRRFQGSRNSPRVHGLRVTPRSTTRDNINGLSLLPPSGSVPRGDGKLSLTPLGTAWSSTPRKNSLESMTLNVSSVGLPPFATDTVDDTKPDTGPLNFPDDSKPELLRLCNKLRKKLNLDPWDEFKRFDDEEFTYFVQTYPQTCRVRYSFDNFTGKLLPLSIVCTMGANAETVRATWQAFPQALLECDDWIGTPLHYACSYRAKKSVVKFLIQQDCTMLEQINQFGRTPLHMACLFKAPVPTIQPLIEVFPQALEILDKDGYSPLHLACENGSSLEVIQALLEVSPRENGLIATSERDLTPLHIACATNAPKAIIQALINHCPDATDQLDHDGQLPLHHAVHAGVPQAIIELLVQTFPRSVEIPNARGQTAYRIAKRKHMPETVLDILDEDAGHDSDDMQMR